MSIRCVRGDQGSACPEGLGSASWRQKGPRRGSARWVWSDPVSQNGTPASAGSLPGTGDWAQNRAWRAGIMSFPLWTMDGRGIRRGWAECLPLASGRFCPFLGRKPGHSRCLGSSATPRILLCRHISYRIGRREAQASRARRQEPTRGCKPHQPMGDPFRAQARPSVAGRRPLLAFVQKVRWFGHRL